MQLIVPTDKVDEVRRACVERAARRRAEGDPQGAKRYEDTARRVAYGLEAYGIRGRGGSSREVVFAAKHEVLYRGLVDGQVIGREAVMRGAGTAVAGATDAALRAVIGSIADVAAGRTSIPLAAKNVGKQSAEGAVDGAKRGTLTGLLRASAHRSGVRVLSDAHVAAACAHLLIDGIDDVRRYRDGEIDLADLINALGHNVMASSWSLYGSAAMAAALGPGLPAVFAGYVTHQIATQAIVGLNELRHEVDAADEDAQRMRALVDASTSMLLACETQLQEAAGELHADNAFKLEAAFEAIDLGLAWQESELVVDGLARIASLCGSELHLADFDEFDQWMTSDSGPLKL